MTNVRHVVFDPKHRYTDPGVKIVHDFVPRLDRQILRIPPGPNDLSYWDEAFQRVWERGDTIAYVDEVTLLLPGTRSMLDWHRRSIVTGRERNVAHLVAGSVEDARNQWVAVFGRGRADLGTQRPTEIGSSVIFTETEHFFVFRLQFEADRDKVCSFTTDRMYGYLSRLKREGRTAKHDFVYYNPDDDYVLRVRATRARNSAAAGTR